MKLVASIGVVVVVALGAWWVVSESGDNHSDEGGHTEATTETLEPREPVRQDGEFTIVTSLYPLQFALEEIVGERATVLNIGAGRDPHDYRPSTQDMRTLQQSDVVVLQGAMLEPWGAEVAAQLQTEDIPIVLASDAVELHEAGHKHGDDEHADELHHEDEQTGEAAHTDEPGDEHHEEAEHQDDEPAAEHEEEVHHDEDAHDEHDHGDYDPHTWLDPVLFSEQVAYLVTVLSTLDPEFASEYEANGAALQAELAALDNQFATALTSCLYEEVIVSHDFLGYVGDRYSLRFHSIAGLPTQDMPSVTTLAELRAEAAEGVGAILLEANAIAAYGETLARETGLQTVTINPVAYSIPAGENYLTMQATNATALAQAFGCNE